MKSFVIHNTYGLAPTKFYNTYINSYMIAIQWRSSDNKKRRNHNEKQTRTKQKKKNNRTTWNKENKQKQ